MDKIAIEGIQIHAYHGVYAREREKGHTFVLDIYLGTDLGKAAVSDRLKDTVDYASVYNLVLSICQEPVNLIERLAHKITEGIFDKFGEIMTIRIRVSKMRPMTMNLCERTYVEVEKQRA